VRRNFLIPWTVLQPTLGLRAGQGCTIGIDQVITYYILLLRLLLLAIAVLLLVCNGSGLPLSFNL
jgi:hypothetical protein